MIYFSVFAGLALLLNICGRFLILRRDQDAHDTWGKALKFCPGADAAYLLFRWRHARLGCLVCALSLGLAAPVAHHWISGKKPDDFSLTQVLRDMTQAQHEAPKSEPDSSDLRKLALVKEKQLFELNQYLQKWFDSLTARQNALGTEDVAEVAEYNRMAAAYQNLMQVWKKENEALNQIKARIAANG
jgi:hypothetical protein